MFIVAWFHAQLADRATVIVSELSWDGGWGQRCCRCDGDGEGGRQARDGDGLLSSWWDGEGKGKAKAKGWSDSCCGSLVVSFSFSFSSCCSSFRLVVAPIVSLPWGPHHHVIESSSLLSSLGVCTGTRYLCRQEACGKGSNGYGCRSWTAVETHRNGPRAINYQVYPSVRGVRRRWCPISWHAISISIRYRFRA
jgi:hypothetical protein